MSLPVLDPVSHVLRAVGMTKAEFGRSLPMSRNGLNQVMFGTYVSIPPRVQEKLEAVAEHAGLDTASMLSDEYGVGNLADAYERWKRSERAGAEAMLAEVKPPFRWNEQNSPARNFAVDVAGGVDTFSKVLKVPPGTLYRWTTGLTEAMPKSIYQALKMTGYQYVTELMETQAAWAQEHAERKSA